MGDAGGIPGTRVPERRALRWLLGGLGLLALAIVVLMPQLLGDLGGLGSLLLVVIAGGLPGLAIVLVLAARRRGPRTDPRHGGGAVGGGGPTDRGA